MRQGMVALLLLASCTTGVRAQAPATSFSKLSGRVHVGQTVVVTDDGGRTLTGAVPRVDNAMIVLRVDGQDRSVSAATVQRVVRLERATGKGALIGFVVGIVAGAASADNCGNCLPLFRDGFFGVIGAGAGAVIGYAHHTEQVLFERPGGMHAKADVRPLLSTAGAGLVFHVRF